MQTLPKVINDHLKCQDDDWFRCFFLKEAKSGDYNQAATQKRGKKSPLCGTAGALCIFLSSYDRTVL